MHDVWVSNRNRNGGITVRPSWRRSAAVVPVFTFDSARNDTGCSSSHLFAVEDIALPHPQAIRESVHNGVRAYEGGVPSGRIPCACSPIFFFLFLIVRAPPTEKMHAANTGDTSPISGSEVLLLIMVLMLTLVVMLLIRVLFRSHSLCWLRPPGGNFAGQNRLGWRKHKREDICSTPITSQLARVPQA